MKMISVFIIGGALSLLLAGCATPVALAPVGPNPDGFQTGSADGQLEVFSALQTRTAGLDPSWYQHADYYLCNPEGQRLRTVYNATGYYSQSPRVVSLPAGKYLVKTRANGILWVEVPVVIDAGHVTRVHLDGKWQPPANTPQNELVNGPGYPVGWRPELASSN
ncbi:MAG TPA: hypothetical protein VMH30_07655 [Verrucomicrobiae bacterium]|nr:hypothetical protein [Verrucomicrobiae bacterium]